MAAIGSYDHDADPSMILPKGEYVAQITESDERATKANNGGRLIALTWKIVDGPYKDRTISDYINYKNPSKICQDIGNAAFAAIRIALFNDKKKIVQDTSEMHNIPCKLAIEVSVHKDTKEESNVIKKYLGMGANAPSTSSGGTTPPWKKQEDLI